MVIEQVLIENQESASIDDISISIKEESIDQIAITEADAAELNRILGEANESISSDENGVLDTSANNDSDDDDIFWLEPNAVIPMPAKCTEDVMPKRESDRVLGNLPFSEKVGFLLLYVYIQSKF